MALRVLFPGSLDVFDVLRVCKHQHGCRFFPDPNSQGRKGAGDPSVSSMQHCLDFETCSCISY